MLYSARRVHKPAGPVRREVADLRSNQPLPLRPAQRVRLSEDERLQLECDHAFRNHEDLYD